MADETESAAPKQLQPYLFKPGQSGNPAGRQKGARNKLSESFAEALYTDFKANGVAAIEAMRSTDPGGYVRVVASLMPKQFEVKTDAFDGYSDEQLAALVSAAAATLGIAPSGDEGTGETAH